MSKAGGELGEILERQRGMEGGSSERAYLRLCFTSTIIALLAQLHRHCPFFPRLTATVREHWEGGSCFRKRACDSDESHSMR